MRKDFKKTVGLFLPFLFLFLFVFLFSGFLQNTILNMSLPFNNFFRNIPSNPATSLNCLDYEQKIIYLENLLEHQDLFEKVNMIDYDFIEAKLVLENIPQDFLIISKGAKDGIKEGMPVLSENFVLLGDVSEVFANFSKIELITAKGKSFDIVGESGFLALANGGGGGRLNIDLIKKETNVLTGQFIKTAALGGKFPADILVGKIAAIDTSGATAFNQAEIYPYFLQEPLEMVLVLSNFLPFDQQQ